MGSPAAMVNAGVTIRKVVHNPYSVSDCMTMVPPSPFIQNSVPEGTIHQLLVGKTRFVPYPTESFDAAEPFGPKGEMTRLFWGQVPYHVSDMQLSWIAYTFGFGANVHHTERIMKKDPSTGRRMPRGCVHTYCAPEDFQALRQSVHKRVLIDDTGVWYAATDIELAALNHYIALMKTGDLPRPVDRPYDSVVIEQASSTYVPHP